PFDRLLSPYPLCFLSFFLWIPPPPRSTLFPYTTLFRSVRCRRDRRGGAQPRPPRSLRAAATAGARRLRRPDLHPPGHDRPGADRSEEHTSELQSRENLVCRLLLEKKKKTQTNHKDHTAH